MKKKDIRLRQEVWVYTHRGWSSDGMRWDTELIWVRGEIEAVQKGKCLVGFESPRPSEFVYNHNILGAEEYALTRLAE